MSARPGDTIHVRNASRLQGLWRRASAGGPVCLRPLLRPAGGRLRPGRAGRRRRPRAASARGPATLWRWAAFLPVDAPAHGLPVGNSPLIRADRLAAELGLDCRLYIKTETSNPTHSFKDRVVAVAAAKSVELGYEALACASTGNLAGATAAAGAALGLPTYIFVPDDLEREKIIVGRRLRRHRVRGRRQLRRRQPALLGAQLRPAVGVRQREHAPLLRRGLEDDRAGDGRAAGLAGARPGGGADRLRVAVHQDPAGLPRGPRGRPVRRRARRRPCTAPRARAARRWRPPSRPAATR